MGYDLKPKNKHVDSISMGLFSWPIFLQETGMGYVLYYGAGREPGTYLYKAGNNGSPVSNDGYKVSDNEAKMMATIARGFIFIQREIAIQWEQLSLEEREFQENYKQPDTDKPLYKKPWPEATLVKIEKFADFAQESGGFSIH